MIEKKRIILNPLDFIAHYMIVLMFGLINVLVIIVPWIQTPPTQSNTVLINSDTAVVTIINLMLMGFLFLVQREKLKIERQSIDLEKDQVLEVIKNVGVGLDWSVRTWSNDFVQADFFRFFGTHSRISIFIREKEVFINCRALYGEFPGFVKQSKIADSFLSALRMKSYELKHQKEKVQI